MLAANTAFYTVPVAPTPRTIAERIASSGALLKNLALEPLRREEETAFVQARRQEKEDQLRYSLETAVGFVICRFLIVVHLFRVV